MAATGIVRSGSSARRRWYVWTILEGCESVFRVCANADDYRRTVLKCF